MYNIYIFVENPYNKACVGYFLCTDYVLINIDNLILV